MKLADARKRLPVVDAGNPLPIADSRRAFKTPEGALPRPRLCVWEITLACDQKCIHCGSRAGAARPGELSTEDALELVKELRALGTGEVVLIGGEAYLRSDFILIIRAVRAAGMACTMTTGGLNLTAARIEAMVEAGITSVNLSIDGEEEAHDTLRGVQGSWRAAFTALARLRAAGVPTAVNTQLNRLTYRSLEGLLEKLHAAGIGAWQLQITSPFGNAADRPDILLQPYDYPELFASLERVVDRCAALGVRLWPANSLGYFGPGDHKLRQFQRSSHYKGCHAGRTTIGVEADGAIKGCPSLGGAGNVAGRWRPGTLRELWAGAPEVQYTRTRDTSALWGYCAECYYADLCRGGCTAVAEPLMGRPGNNPYCHHRALEMDRMGLRERVELVAAAPGVPFDHGLYRIVREFKDPTLRAAFGPLQTDEPRTARAVDPEGAGRPVSPGEG
ncbi:MAG: radical SAM protein [Myxococcales bacterium]|nr:radical SAM protein [Myxococcales bacterium]